MAQQTQVSRVTIFYSRWLKKFPSFSSLANASIQEILREWSGLGYNSRALRSHALAKIVVSKFHSRLPQHKEELLNLPGIGRYTAHAILCFAFGKSVPVVDVNIRRILTRWTKKVQTSSEQISEVAAWRTAEHFLPQKNFYEWNQALMDFGAMVCTARNPKCAECPVASLCRSSFSKTFLQQGVKKKKTEPSWRGIPRRIYRGKILKMLHHQSLSSNDISDFLWKTYTVQDNLWIESLLRTMEKDGLIAINRKRYMIAR